MRPGDTWEGADLPLWPSIRGEIAVPSHALRDGYLFLDADGKLYLYYVGAGEQSIGVATLSSD